MYSQSMTIETFRSFLKQGPLKIAHHNTQNISNGQQQQQSALSIVELAPLNVGSYSSSSSNDAKPDLDYVLKTTVTSQHNTSDQVESQNVNENEFDLKIQNNNGTNDIITIQAKLSLNKQNNEATTEKLQLKAEKIVDNYPVVSEPHEANNAIGDNIFSDVDTNFIDIGQQVPRNNSSKFQFVRSIIHSFFFVSIKNKTLLPQMNQMIKIIQRIRIMKMSKIAIHFI